MKAPQPFRLRLTRDFFDEAGQPKFADFGRSVLDGAPQVEASPFAMHRPEIAPEQLAGANAVIVLTPAVTRQSVSAAEELLAIARFGVGYESVDVRACTEADVLVTITSGAVDRPVAEAVVGWMIGLSHHAAAKHRLVRTGAWDDRSKYMGSELRDRTLGVVGLGGISRCLIRLLENWGMNPPLAYDPYVDAAAAAQAGVTLVDLDTLLRESDFVSLHCPLTPKTRGLIGADQLARMKRTAFLINTARGGIVDEAALAAALRDGRIAGAGIDCFAEEPVRQPHPLAQFEQVLTAPHSIAWTNELFRDIGRAAFGGIVELSLGRRPRGVINPEVFARPGFQEKWRRVSGVSSESEVRS